MTVHKRFDSTGWFFFSPGVFVLVGLEDEDLCH